MTPMVVVVVVAGVVTVVGGASVVGVDEVVLGASVVDAGSAAACPQAPSSAVVATKVATRNGTPDRPGI